MNQSSRFFAIAFLVALCLVLLIYAFNSRGWEGAFLFIAGAGVSFALARVFSSLDPSEKVMETAEETTRTRSVPAASPTEDERDVFIPGRNFEEMLQRLGSDESML